MLILWWEKAKSLPLGIILAIAFGVSTKDLLKMFAISLESYLFAVMHNYKIIFYSFMIVLQFTNYLQLESSIFLLKYFLHLTIYFYVHFCIVYRHHVSCMSRDAEYRTTFECIILCLAGWQFCLDLRCDHLRWQNATDSNRPLTTFIDNLTISIPIVRSLHLETGDQLILQDDNVRLIVLVLFLKLRLIN